MTLETYFTNCLQYSDDGSEVANMEDGESQLYVPVVSDTLGQTQPTSLTVGILLICTLEFNTWIQIYVKLILPLQLFTYQLIVISMNK